MQAIPVCPDQYHMTVSLVRDAGNIQNYSVQLLCTGMSEKNKLQIIE